MRLLAKCAGVLFVVFVLLPAAARASDCTWQLERLQGELRNFEQEAQKHGVEFLAKDVRLDRESMIEDIKKALHDQKIPGGEKARKIEAARKSLQETGELLRRLDEDYRRLVWCLTRGRTLDQLLAESKLLGRDIWEWVRALAPEGLEAATKRVLEASRFLTDYASRIADASTGYATLATSCLAAEQNALGKNPKKKRHGGDEIMVGVLAGAVAGGGLIYANHLAQQAQENGGTSNDSSCPDVSSQLPFPCYSVQGGAQVVTVTVPARCACPRDTTFAGDAGNYKQCNCK